MADQRPNADDLPPDLRRAFRRGLLQHLDEHGARTLEELERDRPWMLGLPLEHPELVVALDLSRRRREIEPIAGTDWAIHKGEWGLTDFGRIKARRLTSRALSWVATSAIGVAVAIIAFGDNLGVSVSLKGIAWERWVAIGVAALLVVEVVSLVLLDYRYGVPRREIAAKWDRYRGDRPRGYTFYTKRRLVLAISAVAVVTFMLLIFWPECDVIFWIAITALVCVVAAQCLLARFYLTARKEWRSARLGAMRESAKP